MVQNTLGGLIFPINIGYGVLVKNILVKISRNSVLRLEVLNANRLLCLRNVEYRLMPYVFPGTG